MYKDIKPLLTPEEQIEHLINKGVKFDYISVCDAVDYLNKNNNYFKLRAYRKNFPKHPDGEHKDKYINLDFAMLQDLSIIDMRLRYAFVHMCLDLEHFAKLKLLKAAERNGEDGYQIVLDYFSHLKQIDMQNTNKCEYDKLVNELFRNERSPYCKDIIQKYDNDFPVWAFVEIVSFGSFIKFYNFCAERFSDKDMEDDGYLFLAVKELRNASAHNNCIINDLANKDSPHKLNRRISHKIPVKIISTQTLNAKTKNERVRQITTLLFAHSAIVSSEGVKSHTKDILSAICERMNRNISYYKHNDTILTFFEFFRNLIDIFYD